MLVVFEVNSADEAALAQSKLNGRFLVGCIYSGRDFGERQTWISQFLMLV